MSNYSTTGYGSYAGAGYSYGYGSASPYANYANSTGYAPYSPASNVMNQTGQSQQGGGSPLQQLYSGLQGASSQSPYGSAGYQPGQAAPGTPAPASAASPMSSTTWLILGAAAIGLFVMSRKGSKK